VDYCKKLYQSIAINQFHKETFSPGNEEILKKKAGKNAQIYIVGLREGNDVVLVRTSKF
jgi:hypothetical protein